MFILEMCIFFFLDNSKTAVEVLFRLPPPLKFTFRLRQMFSVPKKIFEEGCKGQGRENS